MKHPVSILSHEADATLHLKADLSVIGSISDFTYRWSTNSGLDEDDCLRLSLAVSELVTDIVRFAYPHSEEPGSFKIHFRRTASFVEVKIREWGEPFDPDRHVYNVERALKTHNFEGAGLRLIDFMTDEFSFINRGKEGKAYRLVKYMANNNGESLTLEEPKAGSAELGDIKFDINPITLKDAEDISKLIYRCYGNSYPKEEMYHPKHIEQDVVRKKKIGVIAHTPDREPAGYFAVLDSTDSNIGEVGEAVVARHYRRRGLFKKMMEALIEVARNSGLAGIYGKAIAVHEFSQRVNQSYGFGTTAILLADFPPVHLQGIAEDYSQPVSEVVEFLPLNPIKPRNIWLPDRYKEILVQCYDGIGVEMQEPSVEIPETTNTRLETEMDFKEKSGLIIIRKAGNDLESKLNKKLGQLAQHDLNVIYLDIPLMQGDCTRSVEIAKNMEFVFSGLHPLYHNEEDFLRMQRLYCQMDLSKVVTYSATSKNIKEIIVRELA